MRVRVTVLVCSGWLLAACGSQAVPGAQDSSAPVSTKEFHSARLAGGSAGWLIDGSHIYEVVGGSAKATASLPDPGAPADAYVGPNGPVVAVLARGAVSVYEGRGALTLEGSVQVPTDTEFAGVAVAAHAATDVVAAQVQSSSNFSIARGFVSSDNGKTWKTVDMPAFGDLAFAGGAFWLLGGPSGHELWRSEDGSVWREADVTRSEDATVSIPMDVNRLAAVAVAAGGSSSAEEVTVEDWKSGAWSPGSTSQAAAGSAWTVSPTGQLLLGPPGSVQVSAESADMATALVSDSSCPAGKPSCTTSAHAETSDDGGKTWRPVVLTTAPAS